MSAPSDTPDPPRTSRTPRLTRYDSHPFDGAEDAPMDARCAFCGHARVSILHHPSRIRAVQAMTRGAQGATGKPQRTGGKRAKHR